jgi:hypothetical protein
MRKSVGGEGAVLVARCATATNAEPGMHVSPQAMGPNGANIRLRIRSTNAIRLMGHRTRRITRSFTEWPANDADLIDRTNAMWKMHHPPNADFLLNLSRHFSRLADTGPGVFPLFLGDTVHLASDYSSGGKGKGDFFIASLLLFDFAQNGEWDSLRREVRSKYLKDQRRMSFKDLGDARRAQALPEFLSAADGLHGILMSFGIHKDLKYVFTIDKDLEYCQREFRLRAKWERKTFEHMMRIVMLVTFVCGGLVQDTQEILWITDDDDFTGTHERMLDVVDMLHFYRAVNHRSHVAEALVQKVSDTPNARHDMLFEDMCSIPDLAAGALSQCWTLAGRNVDLNISDKPVPVDLSNASQKAKTIFEWHAKTGQRLRRLLCLLVPDPDPKIAFRVLTPGPAIPQPEETQ